MSQLLLKRELEIIAIFPRAIVPSIRRVLNGTGGTGWSRSVVDPILCFFFTPMLRLSIKFKSTLEELPSIGVFYLGISFSNATVLRETQTGKSNAYCYHKH